MKVVTFSYTKGGAGKTASTINTGAWLAADDETRVLLVDLDPQGCIASYFGVPIQAETRTLADALTGRAPVLDAIRSVRWKLDILPADIRLAEVADYYGGGGRFRLLDILAPVRTLYDFVLIDTPPTLGLLMQLGLAAADHIIIPVETSTASVQNIGQVFAILDRVKQLAALENRYYAPRVEYILPTKYHNHYVEDINVAAALARYVQTRIKVRNSGINPHALRYTIRASTAVGKAWLEQKTLVEYGALLPVSQDYKDVAEEIRMFKGEYE